MNGVGYNLAQVNQLMESIKTGAESLKNSMQESWPTLTSAFRREWVGEDENAFENTFSEELGKMFLNCQNVMNTAGQFVHNAAEAWTQWQAQTANSFSGGGGLFGGGASINGLNDFAPSSLNLEIPKSDQTFDASQNRGLQSDGSEGILVSAIDQYVDSVKSSLQAIQSTLETGTSFIGAEQKPAMEKFIGDIIVSAQTITKMVDGFKTETIPALVQAYKSQEQTTKADTESQSSNIESAVNEVAK